MIMVLMLSLLCGCSGGGMETSSKKEGAKSELQIQADELAERYMKMKLPSLNDGKPLKLRIALGSIIPTLSSTATAEQSEVFNSTEIIRLAFEKIYPNVSIEWVRTMDTGSSDSFMQQVTTQLAAGTAPDIVYAWGAALSATGWFYDFNEVLEKPNPFIEGNARWKDIFPNYVFYMSTVSDPNNKVLAIPIMLSPGTQTAVYCNKQIFDSLSLSLPKSWEDLFKVKESIAKEGYVTYAPWGATGSGNRKVNTGVWYVQFNLGPFYAYAQRDKMDYDGDGMQSQMEKLRASYEGHYFLTNDYSQDMWKQVKRVYNELFDSGYENSDYETKWTLGKVAMVENGLWNLPSELSNTEREFDFAVIPPMAVAPDTSSFVEEPAYTEHGPTNMKTTGYNILKDSAMAHGGQGQLDACVAFMQFLTVKECNEMIAIEQKGKALSIYTDAQVPAELIDYLSQSFPIVPVFDWPGGFTSSGKDKMSALLELWVKGSLSDESFYAQFDMEFKKDIEEYIKITNTDTTGWKCAW